MTRPSIFGDPLELAWTRAQVRHGLFGRDAVVRIDRFELRARLGAGAMGTVWLAYDPELSREVAIKILLGDGDGDAARLRREAQAMARLRHPNVVAVHEIGTWRGVPFVAMERVEGPTARAWLAARRRTVDEVLAVYVGAGRGLAAAHAAGLVHRDFKPDNVLVDASGIARVADFGLAQDGGAVEVGAAHAPVSLETTTTTATGGRAGTPAYMALEQLRGEAATARSDQFAFAVALSEALHGRRPYPGTTIAALVAAIRGGVPRPTRTDGAARGALPPRAQRALVRALAADPARRHPDMGALLAELTARPRRVGWIAAGAIAALAVATVGGLAIRGDDRDPCPAAPAAGDVWSAARRAAVDRALRSSTKPYASAVATTVTAALDAYAAAWADAGQRACRDTHVRRVQSSARLDLRTGCLARRHIALDATVARLVAGGADAVATALPLVEALPAIADCDDVDALGAPMATPTDAIGTARLAALEERLGTQEAAANAGQLVLARTLGDALVADARALGYRPFLAEALLALAATLRTRGDDAAATATLRDALAEAQASRHDAVVARAAIQLASLRADGELDRAEELLGIAAATIERLGSPRALQVLHASTSGKLLYNAGRYGDAVAQLERAVRVDVESARAGTLAHAQVLGNLGGALAAAGRDLDAIAALERSLALRERLLGPVHPDLASALNNFATVLGRLKRGAAALALLDRALAIVEQLGGPPALWSMIVDNRAGALARLGRHDDALAAMRRAVELIEQAVPAGDVRRADAYINLAGAMNNVPRARAAAVPVLDRALAIYAATGQGEHPTVATAILTRGAIHLALGHPGAALADCTRADELVEGALGADHPTRLEILRCRGQALIALGRPADAIPVLEDMLARARRTPSYPRAAPRAQAILADARWTLGRDRRGARALAEAALAAFTALDDAEGITNQRAWLAAHRPGR